MRVQTAPQRMPDPVATTGMFTGMVDAGWLTRLGAVERSVPAGGCLDNAGVDSVHVLRSGLALGELVAGRGPRPVRLHFADEVIGPAAQRSAYGTIRLRMRSPGTVLTLSHGDFLSLARSAPDLFAALAAQMNCSDGRHADRLAALQAQSADQRLASLLLEVRARLAVGGIGSGDRFPLPLTQRELGHLTGTTDVTVNRVMRRLRSRGWLEIDRPYYRLLDRPALEAMAGFCSPPCPAARRRAPEPAAAARTRALA
ncbi:Crp/Fnr family transcriptional regulator [Roseivivax sp. CAU 1761]